MVQSSLLHSQMPEIALNISSQSLSGRFQLLVLVQVLHKKATLHFQSLTLSLSNMLLVKTKQAIHSSGIFSKQRCLFSEFKHSASPTVMKNT